MGMLFSFAAVIVLVIVALAGVNMHLQVLFGVVLPYAAVILFIVGFIRKVVKWGKSPVPFHIPTTCGQQKSLPWIKQSRLENPSTTAGVVGRMLLEVLVFRTLFRNLRTEMVDGRVTFGSTKWLWLGGLAFHAAFFTVIARHLRFFTDPVPLFVNMLDSLDGFLQVGVPHLLISGVLLVAAGIFLFLRRVYVPQVRYISLAADYFPLFLIIGIGITGIMMRYITKVDITQVKQLTMGLVSLSPHIPDGIGSIFYIHLFLISALLAYFPFSKLMHLGGVFLSPTRNLANNSREVRHINPWNAPVKVHTYEEYEEEFREKMKGAGLPVEKE